MPVRTAVARLLTACLLGLVWCAGAQAAAAAPAADLQDNAACLSCHAGSARAIQVPGIDGKQRALHAVAPAALAAGVHAKLQCVACHTDISDQPAEGKDHQRSAAQLPEKPDCATCHLGLWTQAQQNGSAASKPRLGVVADNVAQYRQSLHAKPNADNPDRPNAACDDCHDTHSFNVPAAASPERAQWRQGIPKLCGSCHEDQLEDYSGSVHGQEVLSKHNPKAAVCSDCHTAHAIANSSSATFKNAITAQCGNCHAENLASYKATYHGQISTLGYNYTAKCYNCHGSHDILRVDDPKSKVAPDRRMQTCRSCHDGKKGVEAPAGFASFQPHGNHHDFQKYPQMWIAFQIMVQLLLGTFGFFWLHTLLWFWREYQERKANKGKPHVKLTLPARFQGKHVQRFSPIWRLGHISFALSLMILTLTGMPLFYPDAPWAAALMAALGGPQVAGTIHRVNAVIFAGVFFWHLAYMALGIARKWQTFAFFGPDSMIPNLKDGYDMVAMAKWFFKRGPRPQFDRWTYWEKFDYWAPFWGVTIIGVSGLVMWLPGVFGAVLPGWVFNVAAIFHGEEAFLAVVFLFTVHFFNNHFRPDKFPLEVVMFTGTFSLEALQHEHPLEFQRLLASGELERRLVDAPSAGKLAASRVLGFTLIAIGLSLLTMVAIGFFSAL